MKNDDDKSATSAMSRLSRCLALTVGHASPSIEARAQLAMSRVVEGIDPVRSRQYHETAKNIAHAMGRGYFNGTDHDAPEEPFSDEPELNKAWGDGIYVEGMRQSAGL